jgi:hypothetical protein
MLLKEVNALELGLQCIHAQRTHNISKDAFLLTVVCGMEL